MIRDEIRRAWAKDPARVILATVATLLAVPIAWCLVVLFLVTFQ